MLKNSEELAKTTEYIFTRDIESDAFDEEEECCTGKIKEDIDTYGWDVVFESWFAYLREKCDTPEKVIGFANLFWIFYGEVARPVPEPYKFLAYFYFVLNLKPARYDAADIMDSIVSKVLPASGYPEKNPYANYDYIPEKDPEIIAEAEKYKAAGK